MGQVHKINRQIYTNFMYLNLGPSGLMYSMKYYVFYVFKVFYLVLL